MTATEDGSWAAEVRDGKRFRFGANWQRFAEGLDAERLEESKRALLTSLRLGSLDGLSFLDAGGGSGLHSLAARLLGARVHTFDFDPDSVACAAALRDQFCPSDEGWTIERGSVLDADYLRGLGRFDIVYSWGVLHHTGAMWSALDLIDGNVAPGGRLFLALYNDQGRRSDAWRSVKKLYVRSPRSANLAIALAAGVVLETRPALGRLSKLPSPLPFTEWRKKQADRGTSVWTDLIDWVGGYPFEVSRPEEVFDFYRSRGYRLDYFKTCGGGHGCNEYVLVKEHVAPRPADAPCAEPERRASA